MQNQVANLQKRSIITEYLYNFLNSSLFFQPCLEILREIGSTFSAGFPPNASSLKHI